ncbi:MAG: tyrosine-protein phosphatase [Ruminococcaceae bacterium]|nr:tyrosine-protein phosphatase [Oscillospiraceae bacterium]
MNSKKTMIRRIHLEKLENTRDLGGFIAENGRKIKPFRLIRSGELAKATSQDIYTLTEKYNLKTIVDLRTDIEIERKPDPEIDGVNYINLPVVDEATVGITREKTAAASAVKLIKTMDISATEYMQNMYRALVVNETSINVLKNFFELLLASEDGAVLFHCSAGKDRVGALTAILLSILGVSRDVIIKDYLATQKFGEKFNRKYKLAAILISKNKRVSEYANVFLSTNKEFLMAFFDEIEEKYGTVLNYAEKCLDLDAEKQNKLKAMYLE